MTGDAKANEQGETIYARWIAQREAGDAPSLEQLCARHGAHAVELRELYQDEQRFAPADADLGDAGPSGIGKLPEGFGRLRRVEHSFERYRVQREIGRGGMGRVLEAVDEDLERTLALKVIDGGAGDSGPTTPAGVRALGRFLREARLMGRLEHPGIVPVHELALDDEQGAYFSMRMVRGHEFGAVIDAVHGRGSPGTQAWSLTAALRVLEKAALAVAYAHDHDVIHRDLKPSNLMVGDFGEAYVMDWGLARRLDESVSSKRESTAPDASEDPLRTLEGDILGTPAYMPPEQARGQLDLVGPASDIYSMGAMLYHLLVGQAPYLGSNSGMTTLEVLDAVRKGPPADSEAGTGSGAPAPMHSICRRAMARDPKERYGSMAEMAADLSAYLEDRVVRAHRVGAIAELRMWVHRNKGIAVGLVAALLLALLGTAYSNHLIKEQRDQAILAGDRATAARNDAVEAGELALAARLEAEAVTDFVQTVLLGIHPGVAKSRDTTLLSELLDSAMLRVDRALEGQPLPRSRVLYTLGRARLALGEASKARATLDEAFQIQSKHLGLSDLESLETESALGLALAELGELESAVQHLERVLESREELLGPTARMTLASKENLGRTLLATSSVGRGRALLEEAHAEIESVANASEARQLENRYNLALGLLYDGKGAEAVPILEQVLADDVQAFGWDAYQTLTTMQALGGALGKLPLEGAEAMARDERAFQLIKQSFIGRERLLPPGSDKLLAAANNLAIEYAKRGDVARAETLFRDALDGLPPGHLRAPQVAYSLCTQVLIPGRRAEEALEVMLEAERQLEAMEALPGYSGSVFLLLGHLLEMMNRGDEARTRFERARAVFVEVFGPDSPKVAECDAALGALEDS